jgi:hypothetical protein
LSALVTVLASACDRGGGGREAAAAYPLDRRLRVDQVQALSTHNSYHLRPTVDLPAGLADSIDYAHLPLDEQLESQGVRGFEIDVATRGEDFPVVHTPVIDANTNCASLPECLQVIKAWSDDHPGHVPIFLLVEPKDGLVERGFDPLLGTYDRAVFDRMDREIRRVLGPDDLLTPDEVRGKSKTLRDAVRERGWPTLNDARGTIVIVLNNGGENRQDYLEGRPSLQGAPMFVTADPDAPSAAVVKVDDPDEARIRRLVEQHFIVRTRADADTVEARTNDTARRELALRSGAQIVSTDYPVPDPATNPEYSVGIPGGRPARCNPVQSPKDCRSVDVENPKHLRKRR